MCWMMPPFFQRTLSPTVMVMLGGSKLRSLISTVTVFGAWVVVGGTVVVVVVVVVLVVVVVVVVVEVVVVVVVVLVVARDVAVVLTDGGGGVDADEALALSTS